MDGIELEWHAYWLVHSPCSFVWNIQSHCPDHQGNIHKCFRSCWRFLKRILVIKYVQNMAFHMKLTRKCQKKVNSPNMWTTMWFTHNSYNWHSASRSNWLCTQFRQQKMFGFDWYGCNDVHQPWRRIQSIFRWNSRFHAIQVDIFLLFVGLNQFLNDFTNHHEHTLFFAKADTCQNTHNFINILFVIWKIGKLNGIDGIDCDYLTFVVPLCVCATS